MIVKRQGYTCRVCGCNGINFAAANILQHKTFKQLYKLFVKQRITALPVCRCQKLPAGIAAFFESGDIL